MSEYTNELYDFGEKFDTIDAEEFADASAAIYSAEVNLNRAIPDVRDGLKPVQRRALYGMHELGLEPKKPHVKSARISGEVMGKYHPHGDSIYGAFALMAQDFSMNETLVDGHGNFGSITGKKPAAQRYTESRLSPAGHLLVKDLKKNAVQMIPNFDGSEIEPRVLPARYPQALLNGQLGIGWSIKATIAPHNINELLDLSIYTAQQHIKSRQVDINEIKQFYQGPDFMTGCQVVLSEKEYLKELTTGYSKFNLRSVVEYHVDKKTSYFSIKHVPYKIETDKLKNQIVTELTKSKAFGLESIEDESRGMSLNIKFIFKKGTSEERLKQIVDHLYKKTDLQVSVTTNNLMIHKGRPQQIGVLKYIEIFNQFRLETLKNIWTFELDSLKKRLSLINALLKLEDVTDEVISLAKQSKSKSDFKDKLIVAYQFDEPQAEYIASLQLYQLGRTNFEALRSEKEEKELEVKNRELWLSNEKEALKQLVLDLKSTKKEFKGRNRKSEIVKPEDLKEVKEIKVEQMIDDKAVKVIIKRNLEMFQIGSQAYQNQIESYKDDDIVSVIDTRTTKYVMAVTSEGYGVTRLVNDLPRIDLNGSSEKLNKQIPDLKSDSEFVGGFTLSDDTNRVLILSKSGYLKVMLPSVASPKTTTKSYFKKLRQIAKLKDNDSIASAFELPFKKLNKFELQVEFNDTTKKSGKTIRKCALSKFTDRTHGVGGSGSKAVNSLVKGKHQMQFANYKIVDISNQNQTEDA